MYFFDRDFLKQYIDIKSPVEVYADREWYKVVDNSDLESDKYCVGYNENGQSHIIDYKEIEQIKSAGNIITIDALQDKIFDEPGEDDVSDKLPPADPSASGGPEDVPTDETDPNAPPDPNSAPEDDEDKKESFNIKTGDFVENLNEASDYYLTKGVVTYVFPDTKKIEYRIYRGRVAERIVENISKLHLVKVK